MTRDEENQLLLVASRWEAIVDILAGEEPADFLMAFPEVRRVADLYDLAEGLK